MTTITRLKLDQQALSTSSVVLQALAQLLEVREHQLAESDREAELFAEGERKTEMQLEAISDKIVDICIGSALGPHGTPTEQLERIRGLLTIYSERLEIAEAKLNEVRATPAEVEP